MPLVSCWSAESNSELVLAGDGEMRIENLVARYKLQNLVRITGWISSDQVREEMMATRARGVAKLPGGFAGRDHGGHGALRRAGIPELVEPGQHGWLVPAGDAEALAAAMEACLGASPDEISRMEEAARARLMERHDVSRAFSGARLDV
jgi:glycosyltransferase involved in cell wall biosynthesis